MDSVGLFKTNSFISPSMSTASSNKLDQDALDEDREDMYFPDEKNLSESVDSAIRYGLSVMLVVTALALAVVMSSDYF